MSAAAVRIVDLQPTVLFLNESPLRQVAWLRVENSSGSALSVEVKIESSDRRHQAAQTLTIPPGLSQQELLMPDIETPASFTVRLIHGNVEVAAHLQEWVPQRKWKVFLVKSSHEDIGYENFLFVKQKEIADFIELGQHLSGPPDAAPDAEQKLPAYHYFLETLLFPRYYMEERSEAEWRILAKKSISTGSMGLGGAPSGIHTHWMDYEELVRTTYVGRREYKDRFGLDLDTYVIVDNPSMSWSTAQVIAGAGYKYAVRFGAPFRAGGNNDYATTKLPAVFWWKGPDQSRVLYSWRNRYSNNFWFGEAVGSYSNLTDLAAINVNREIMSVQEDGLLGPYPYDALLVPSYRDHLIPAWDNTAFVKWRAKYRYPEIRIADPRDFMAYVDKKYSEKIPELSGDLNNFSADYATIDPEAQQWKRRASRLVPEAEGLNAVALTLDPTLQPQGAKVAATYQRMFDFDEHSWPTTPVPGDFHKFNAQWGKHLEGKRSLRDATELFESSMSAMAANVSTGNEPLLMVFNPLAHLRTDIVTISGEHAEVIDEATGVRIPVQRLNGREGLFIAKDVPAFGYRGYRLSATKTQALAAPSLAAGPTGISNEYYELSFDPKTGAITSIRDKIQGRELTDETAAYKFNQLVFVDKIARESVEGANYSPAGAAKLEYKVGPVFAEMKVTRKDARLGDATIIQTVRLYAGQARFDIINELNHFGALNTPFQERYRKNVFFAFPVAIDGFESRAEYAGGVVRPYKDQLRWGSYDFLYANRWIDVSNSRHGVTMAPWNAATVHFGEIRYNQLTNDYQPNLPHFFSFAWSNRMAGLKELSPADWNATFRYTFTSHLGDWDTGAATDLGWKVASPLHARVIDAGQKGALAPSKASFLSIDAPNVQLVVLKESELPGRGWIIRLIETEGRATAVKLECQALTFDGAAACDLAENDRELLPVSGKTVSLNVGAHGYATLRLFSKEMIKSPPTGVVAEALSDKAIRIRWEAAPGALAYAIYRSVDPEAPPTTHSFVGRTATVSYVDDRLSIGDTYYYRVAALTGGNMQGPVSMAVSAQTKLANEGAPEPVRDLDVVRLGATRLMLCWQRSHESDVARYLVYRSGSADFKLTALQPIAEVKPNGYALEYFKDETVAAGETYYYKVVIEDWAGNRQENSTVAVVSTPND